MVDILSIVFIVIILIFGLIGLFKGFFAVLMSFFKNLVSLLLAVLLCKPLGSLISKMGLGTAISNPLYEKLLGMNSEVFKEALTAENKEVLLNKGYDVAKLPEVIRPYITNIIKDKIPTTGSVPLGEFIANGIAALACIMIAFIIIFIVAFVVFLILQLVLKNINRIPLIGPLNRILGCAMGAAFALLIISGICYLLTFIMGIPGSFSESLTEMLKLNEGQEADFTIAKFFYQHNPLQWILDNIINK